MLLYVLQKSNPILGREREREIFSPFHNDRFFFFPVVFLSDTHTRRRGCTDDWLVQAALAALTLTKLACTKSPRFLSTESMNLQRCGCGDLWFPNATTLASSLQMSVPLPQPSTPATSVAAVHSSTSKWFPGCAPVRRL